MKLSKDILQKPYDHTQMESAIYEDWQNSGYFNPDNLPETTMGNYSCILPPPNVTGTLHTGHALMLAVQDLAIRYKRMSGYKTLWLPGTDHAAIATQSVVEKKIYKEENKSRHDLGREELLKRVNTFALDSQNTILSQFKSMGASLDWSRLAFTLDDKRNKAVNTAFKKMYDDGIIYRGSRIVNWDPKGQTTISDDEVVYVEEKTKLYYLKYGPFEIATSRPETKFGDKYVVMHPDDKRYEKYSHGEKIKVEWINGEIEATIIKDNSIDMEFGTGVMTITPWHSMIDFEIAERHKLNYEQIIDKYGKLLPIAQELSGVKIKDAREKIIEKLQNKNLVIKEEEYTHNIATAERTGGIIEPQIMKQWFVGVNKEFDHFGGKTTLKKLMHAAVSEGKVKINPEKFEKVYFHWIENLRDWCISRQIWYGHRVPVWYKKGSKETYCGLVAPTDIENWEQDEDTLDTWFSSGLWTFSTLGWPDKDAKDMEFHPTDFMETGHDILFFWVARMVLFSTYLLNEVPFKNVYLHGLVRDAQGRKMSKSLGNVLDPRELTQKYGTDSLRMALIVGNGPGNDLKLTEDKINGYKKFANKIWNATRFVMENIEGVTEGELNAADTELYAVWRAKLADITLDLESYRYHLASEKIYDYFWKTFCDEIIETHKVRIQNDDEKASAQRLLKKILREMIITLHPFMPFITETLWQLIKEETDDMLLVTKWATR